MEFKDHYGNFKLVHEGHIRHLYEEIEVDHSRLELVALVATDRAAVADDTLYATIPGKGKTLTAINACWSELIDDLWDSADLIPTAFIATHRKKAFDMKAAIDTLDALELLDRTTLEMHLEMLPYEWTVRGYIAGALWEAYEDGLRDCWGYHLPDGLREGDKLPFTMVTPTTKVIRGQHGEPISLEDLAEHLSCLDVGNQICLSNWDGSKQHHTLYELVRYEMAAGCRRLYKFAAEYAENHGLILADTRFRLGACEGELYIGDEILTPDSSHYWLAKDWQPGLPQKSLDKQLLRDYVAKELGRGKHGYEIMLPDDLLAETTNRYVQLQCMLFPDDE